MSDDEQPVKVPILLDRARGIGYVFIAGQWIKMAQRMYDDRQLRDAVFQHQQAQIDELRVELDRQQRKDLYDRVIERFNRAHGQNSKITLADICRDMSVSYEAVKKHRQRTPKRKGKK